MFGSRDHVSRRDFVTTSGAIVGSMAAAGGTVWRRAGADDRVDRSYVVPRGVLGRTKANVSRLGIGCAHFKRKHVGPGDVREVLHAALDLGVNYLDVAPSYGNEKIGFAEEKMGPTIQDIRKRVFLVTKTDEPSREGTWRLLRQSMKRLKTDHLDLVHLHNVGNERRFTDLDFVFSDQGALGALREARKQGAIRFIGASGHLHPSRFHAVLDTGEIDVLMNAVNFVAQHTYDFEHKVWARARREDLGLVAMKVLGGQTGEQGYRLPNEQYRNAIRYALSLPGISCAVIGTETVAELQQAAEAVANFEPLADEESHALARLGLKLAGMPAWKTAYGTPLT